jgi:hypothetical protein
MAATVQCEALAPNVLAAEVRAAIESVVDLDVMEATRERSEAQRQQIIEAVRRLSE